MENIIYSYTRKEALEDGVLVDVSQMAKEAGFKYPVAITQELNSNLENIPPEHSYEDYNGRLWDVLWMLRVAIAKQGSGDIIHYKMILHTEDNPAETPITLKAQCHPGDDMEPCITVMFPWED